MAEIEVLLLYSPSAREVQEEVLRVPAGSTLHEAIASCGRLARDGAFADLIAKGGHVGVWGRKMPPETVLQAGDRIEVYRPLRVDPKVARRERFDRQGGSRRTGLFAKRRAGGKPGYGG